MFWNKSPETKTSNNESLVHGKKMKIVGAVAGAVACASVVRSKYQNLKAENVELKQQNIELEKRSGTDQLTGIANRWRLDDRLNLLISQYDRKTVTDIGFIQMDVRKFKQINDTEGTHMGDIVLRSIANSITSRPQDVVARIGGDEIAFLADLTNPKIDNQKCTPQELLDNITNRIMLEAENSPEVLAFNERHGLIGEQSVGIKANSTLYLLGDDLDSLIARTPPKLLAV